MNSFVIFRVIVINREFPMEWNIHLMIQENEFEEPILLFSEVEHEMLVIGSFFSSIW